MASELFISPCCPVRYAHLITAGFYDNKWTYSVELILDENNAEHKAFIEQLESEFVAHHGAKKNRAEKGTPWAIPGKNKNGKIFLKFKTNRDFADGTQASPPPIIDAKRQPWDGREIGNGSELKIRYKIIRWDRGEGCGVTLIPKACQVVSFVPREDDGQQAAEEFDEVADGFALANDASGFVGEGEDYA